MKKKTQEKHKHDFWDVNVIPVGPLLSILEDPIKFAVVLEERARAVMAEWVSLNANFKNPLDRVVAEKHFIVMSHHFKGHQGRPEKSDVEMQLSTWGYTANAQRVQKPEAMILRDVKARNLNHFSQWFLNVQHLTSAILSL